MSGRGNTERRGSAHARTASTDASSDCNTGCCMQAEVLQDAAGSINQQGSPALLAAAWHGTAAQLGRACTLARTGGCECCWPGRLVRQVKPTALHSTITMHALPASAAETSSTHNPSPHLDGGEGLKHHAGQLSLLLSPGHNRGTGHRQLLGRGAHRRMRPAGAATGRGIAGGLAATCIPKPSSERDGGTRRRRRRQPVQRPARRRGRDASQLRCGCAPACGAHAGPVAHTRPRAQVASGGPSRSQDLAADTTSNMLTGSQRRQRC